MSGSGKRIDQEVVFSPSSAPATPALVLSNSGKRMDPSGKKKYVKQVTGRHNDTELHLAAQRGDLAAVRMILGEIEAQMTGTAVGADFDAQVAEIRAAVVNDVNEVDETALFTAAEKGFLDVVVELLKYSDRESLIRRNKSGFDALHIAAREGHQVMYSNCSATRGHTEVVNLLLEQDPSLIELSKNNGKNALHFAARQGHVEIVKALLGKDPQLARRTDKKGQTALHMAVKGTCCGVVKALVDADPALVMLPDRAGNTALHLEQTRKTNKNVHGIAKELKKLHREGINNATNSVTVVAVLFATVAFAAIFTVPGGTDDNGAAVVAEKGSFKVFFIFNAIALFTSLAVVVVQITLVRGEMKAERRVVEVINKLMWLASVCTSVSFIASSYIVVGRHFEWAAVLVTLIGGVIMAGVLGTMTFYVVKTKRTRSMRKREKSMRRSGSNSWHHLSDFSDSQIDSIYAI
ncbi:hypothetical protein GW17_00027758 [Ensete ventricosum]|nr:hypothetical protein GW17_00027758 [Ensete ventricosum]